MFLKTQNHYHFASIAFDKYQSSKDNGSGFMRLINRNVTGFERKIADKAKQSLVDITVLLPKLEFNIHNKTLPSQKEELVSSVKRELEKINAKTQQLVNTKKDKAKKAIKTDHFSKMAWISAIFAMAMLIISPFTKESGLVWPMTIEIYANIVVFFSLIALFFIEFSEQKRTKLISSISMIVCTAVIISTITFENIRNIFFECSSITTVSISFIGFVVYFIKCNIHLYLLQIRFNKKLKKLQIGSQVEVLKNQISDIEKDLKEPGQLASNDLNEPTGLVRKQGQVGLRLISV
jgi:hypothetical protein